MQQPEISLEEDLRWMGHALSLAKNAEDEGEVPVGAVIVQNGVLVAEGWNRNITLNDPSAHAEIIALRNAGQHLLNHRMPGCVMYVTLEPCAMCVGALIHARLDSLVYGAPDPKTGALGGACDLPAQCPQNHSMRYRGGILSNDSSRLLKTFFQARR